MERKIRFNTGRQYSKEGQIIEAQEFGSTFDEFMENIFDEPEDQWIDFNDITRQIKGRIYFCKLSEEAIMRNYDKGNYIQI